MKKFIIIAFLSTYLFSSTELFQLAKLPLLVEHYIEHKEKSLRITFWDFLQMHYANDDVKYPDFDKDSKLPFKSHEGCLNLAVFAPVPETCSTIATPLIIQPQNFPVYEINFISSAYLSSIWQPPKTC